MDSDSRRVQRLNMVPRFIWTSLSSFCLRQTAARRDGSHRDPLWIMLQIGSILLLARYLCMIHFSLEIDLPLCEIVQIGHKLGLNLRPGRGEFFFKRTKFNIEVWICYLKLT